MRGGEIEKKGWEGKGRGVKKVKKNREREKKKEICAGENPAGRTWSLSQDLRVTSEPA